MKVLITFADASEFAPWRKLRRFVRGSDLAFTTYTAEISGGGLRVVLTGMGPLHARRALLQALGESPDICISAGVAGGLQPARRRGQIIAARRVMELQGGGIVDSNARLLDAAISRGASPIKRLLSSSHVVSSPEGKSRLARLADAVDMESYTILSLAAARGIPAVAIRAISDTADDILPLDFESMLDANGKITGAKLASAIARSPHKIPALLRLARNVHRAASNLARFLDVYLQDVMQPESHFEKTSEIDSGAVAAAEAVRA